MCKANYYICGTSSYHDNGPEDRRWSFKCCRSPNHYTQNCEMSGLDVYDSVEYVNGLDQFINYTVGDNKVMTGAYSFHDNGAE